MAHGIYQKGNWVILQKDDGSRTALFKSDYENSGYTPSVDALDTEIDFHVGQLSTTAVDPAKFTGERPCAHFAGTEKATYASTL